MPLTAPKGTVFTLCQYIRTIESIVNLNSSLFLEIDTTEEGEVIVTCDKSMKNKGETILSHFAIYLEVIFGSIVWDAFTKWL